jgi:signal peptidase I
MATEAQKRRRIPGWLELLLLLALAVALSVAIKAFLVQMFFVPSESMEPLFVTNDRILVEKVSYWTGEVERGDVVVFRDPGDWLGPEPELSPLQEALQVVGLYPAGGHLVKRVVAIGGDHVTCCDGEGRVRVNDVPLEEGDYIREGQVPSTRDFDVTVPEGRLWVMGDNRANSEDSRYHQRSGGGGTVPVEDVVGKVWAVVWPLDRWHLVGTPDTYAQPELDSPR